MENGEILYGYCDGNFWCDMGDRSAYLLCNLRENGGKSVLGAGTKTDGATVENSLLFVEALCRYRIPVEFHLYPQGRHGLALATELTAGADGGHIQPECASWVELAHTWLKNI